MPGAVHVRVPCLGKADALGNILANFCRIQVKRHKPRKGSLLIAHRGSNVEDVDPEVMGEANITQVGLPGFSWDLEPLKSTLVFAHLALGVSNLDSRGIGEGCRNGEGMVLHEIRKDPGFIFRWDS